MAETKTTENKGSKVPNSSDVLDMYLDYIKMMEKIADAVVTSGLDKPKTINKIKQFNSNMKDVVVGLKSTIIEITKDLAALPDGIDGAEKAIKVVANAVGVATSITQLANPVIMVKAFIALKVIEKFIGRISTMMVALSGKMKGSYTIIDPDTKKKLVVGVDSDEFKKSLENLDKLITVMNSIQKLIKSTSLTALRAKLAIQSLTVVELFVWKCVDLFIGIANRIKDKEITGAINAVERIQLVILRMKKVMTSCILMAVLGIVAIPGLVVVYLFTKLLVALFLSIALTRPISHEALKGLLLIGKVALLMTAVALGFILLGAFIIKYWKIALVGLAAMMITVVGLVLFFGLMSLIKKPIQEGSKNMLWMVLSLVVFSAGMVLVGYMTKLLEWKDFLMMSIVTGIAIGVFVLLGKFGTEIQKGGIGMLLVSGSLILFALGLMAVNRAIKDITLKEFGIMAAVVGVVVGIYALLGIPAVAALVGLGGVVMAAIGASLLLFALGLASVGRASKKIDVGAIDNLMSGLKNLINKLGSSVINPLTYAAAIYNVMLIRSLVGSLAKIASDIANVAKLQIPSKWNDRGVAIEYEKLTQSDFEDATKNIETIVTTLLSPEMIASLETVADNFTKKQAKVIGKVFSAIGNVSSIADVVMKFSTMMIPDQWDKEGRAIHYIKVEDTAITSATDNVVTIITSILDAITRDDTTTKLTNMKKKAAKNLDRIFTALGGVSSIADSVIKLATLQIPDQWNKDGKPIHYIKVNDDSITNATDNIVKIMKTIFTAISSDTLQTQLKQLKKKSAESLGTVFDSIGKVGNVVDLIIKLASGTYPVEFNPKTGKATKYGSFDDLLNDNGIQKVQDNIATMMKAVISPFTDKTIIPDTAIKDIENKSKTLVKAIDVIKKVTDIDATKYNGNVEKTTKATNSFLTTLNSVDQSRLNSMDRISKNLLEFSKSINGNFDALADAISEKLVKVLTDLNDTLDGVGEKLDDNKTASFNSAATAPTTIAAQTQPNKELAAKEEKGGQKLPDKNMVAILELLTKINTKLQNGKLNVDIKNTEPLIVQNK